MGWALHQAGRRHSPLSVLYVPDFSGTGDERTLDPGMAEQGQKELEASLDHLGGGSRTSVHTVEPEESTAEAIRARALDDRDGLVVVGPLDTNTLVRLIFGSD